MLTIALSAEKDGEDPEAALQLALGAVLASPQFLFRLEQVRDASPSADFDLAARLSYFLWSSMPDDELFQLAARGALRRGDTLRTQTRRMLADPRAQALSANFAGQWLQTRRLDELAPDPTLFPEFDESLRSAMRRETQLFCRSIQDEDRSILDFLDADYTFVNERLARHYGFPGVSGDDFRRISLAGTSRGGVLTQASVLAATSNPTRTSPVKRGKWILENILGTPPPPPPSGVEALKEGGGRRTSGTLRERMERHRTDPNCASCHRRMDPLGFALENFDAIGAWRTIEGGQPIDASGTPARRLGLPRCRGAAGPSCIARRDAFARCLAEKMLTYALGRGLERSDRRAVDRIVQQARAGTVPVLGPGARHRRERTVPRAHEEWRHAMRRPSRIARRTALKGLGVSIALPMLEAMRLGPARRVGRSRSVPLRVAFVYVPNGVHMPDWTPRGHAGTAFDLPAILEPLARSRMRLLVLSGLTLNPARALGDGGGDHARAMASFLTGRHPRKTDGADLRAGISVDQLAAREVGSTTRFPSLEIGCEGGRNAGECDHGYSCAYQSNLSWRGDATPVAKQINPRLVFDRLFGAPAGADPARADRRGKSILDFVGEDARRIGKTLGTPDRRKLDEYLTGIREIERRIATTRPTVTAGGVKLARPLGIPADYREHLRLMADLLVLAFQSDLTRIATFVFANDGSNRSYPAIGVPDGHHDLSHHGGEPAKQQRIRTINRFHVEQLAYLLEKLKSIPEGSRHAAGSLPDRLRQRDQRRQRPYPRKPADPGGGTGQRDCENGPAHPLRQGDAVDQPLRVDPRTTGDRGAQLRRRHRPSCRARGVSEVSCPPPSRPVRQDRRPLRGMRWPRTGGRRSRG